MTVTRAHLTDRILDLDLYDALPRTKAADLVDAVFAEISREIVAGEPVKIQRFGTFTTRRIGARPGRNPKRPGDGTLIIEPRTRLTFKPSIELRDQVRRGNSK